MTLLYHAFVNKSRRSLVYHPQPVAVYHQCEALHIIKPQVRYTLKRDEIHGVAVMISSPAGADDMPSRRLAACGLDKQKENFW